MHQTNIQPWQHAHTFGQDQKRAGERRTVIVTVLTAVMMLVEIVAGIAFGSMALLADGLHMASHATALCINAFAYVYARHHSRDKRFSFGTGKVNTLGGFTGAVLLGFFALFMAWESIKRMVSPVAIEFNQAIFVAVIGLVVNGVSVLVLDVKRTNHHHGEGGHHHDHSHDHNLRSAYFHVLADALTSVLAIFALLTAKYLGLIWMDPLMGIVGAVLVSRWAWRLLRETSYILLDREGPESIQRKIKENIEKDGDSRITDLHLWSVGPDIYSAIISVVASHPLEPEHYKRLISSDLGLVHITVEVCKCKDSSN
ncbi:MAG: cation diffusion facilitator family transporter [Omnitrophica bacterium RIFOXYB12_FULL_50_7]|nr:MAG: cation diffusion facilitator family transporter [Omnitrophica bacterium RIFOXYB12_FULL_50_7]